MTVPAGWYDDPDDATRVRYWDGQAFTQWSAPKNAPPIWPPAAPAGSGAGSNAGLVIGLVAALAVLMIVTGVFVFGVFRSATSTSEHSGTVSGFGGSSPSAEAGQSIPPGTCEYPLSSTPSARRVAPPPVTGIETKQAFVAHLHTNLGLIDIRLRTADAPCTVNSFRSLARLKYFDNTPCHRLTTHGIFVLQCGDPLGRGTGGPGYTFADENLRGATYRAGTVAMANSGPDTNGSQFFLAYKDFKLDPNYTPFGTITKGLDIIQRVARAGSDPAGDGQPRMRVEILSVEVEPTGG